MRNSFENLLSKLLEDNTIEAGSLKNKIELFLNNNNNNITFKLRDNGEYLRYSIENKELSKLDTGCNYLKGKHLIYILNNEYVFVVSNSYGWTGVGSPYTTNNYVEKIFGSSSEFDELIKSLKYNISLNSIEEAVKKYFNISTYKPTKYDSLVEFAQDNPNLLKRYILNEFNNQVLFNDLNDFKQYLMYKESQKIIKTNFIVSKEIKNLKINTENNKSFFSKLNSKLNKNIYFLNHASLIQLMDILNIDYSYCKLSLKFLPEHLVSELKDIVFALSINSSTNLSAISDINYIEENSLNISLKDNALIVEKIEDKFDLTKELEKYKNLKISKNDLNKILEILEEY